MSVCLSPLLPPIPPHSEWSLRSLGVYLFGIQVLLASCMLVMIFTYIFMGLIKVDTTGPTGKVEFGIFPYPKTGFLPFGSTVWSLSVLLLLTAVDLWISLVAFNSTMEGTQSGLGTYISAKCCVMIIYLCVFGLTTEWMGSEVAIAICYSSFSIGSTVVALMLFNALSLGGEVLTDAGFDDGESERRPLKSERPSQHMSTKYV